MSGQLTTEKNNEGIFNNRGLVLRKTIFRKSEFSIRPSKYIFFVQKGLFSFEAKG